MKALEAPTVLANLGIPVRVNEVAGTPHTNDLNETGLVWEPTAETIQRYVRFDNRLMVWLEGKYTPASGETDPDRADSDGNPVPLTTMNKWRRALNSKPTTITVMTLAHMWRESEEKVAARLIDGAIEEYQLALSIAALRAEGVSVDDAGKFLWESMKAQQEVDRARQDVIDAQVRAIGEAAEDDSQAKVEPVDEAEPAEPELTPTVETNRAPSIGRSA